MTKRRQISLLPQVHQTDALKRFFNSTVDQLFDEGKTVPVSGYIGRKPSHYDATKDFYKPEPTASRERYQLEPMMISADADRTVQSQLFYEDLLARLNQEGALTNDPNRLFGAGYYSWAPPIDIDRIMNFQQYYWAGSNTGSLILTVPGVEIGQRYYGDGATVTFRKPGLLASRTSAEQETAVLMGGVLVPPSAYTDDGSTVTFHTAPPEDKLLVVFRYGNIGDGVKNTFRIPAHCVASQGLDSVYVYVNAREVAASDYTINDTTITLHTPAPANSQVMVTRIRDLKEIIEGKPQFDCTGLTFYPTTSLLDGMKIKLIDPINFLNGFDLKAYGHPWDQVGHSTYFVEGADISIVLIPIAGTDLSGDGYQADDPRYVVIARSDKSRSFFSRINRWVHRDALIMPEDANVENQAKRPIIEFLADVQQFNYGTYRVQNTSGKISTLPIYNGAPILFSDINGLPEGSVTVDDGINPHRGDVLFVNLEDSVHNNRLYYVDTVAADNDPSTQVMVLEPLPLLEAGAVTQIRFAEYWFDGYRWHDVATPGEAPLFDLFDADGASLSDPGVYPESNFAGSAIFNFATGSGRIDQILRKKLRHDKYGQIVFENELETRSYAYRDGNINGYYYYRSGDTYLNAWHKADEKLQQAIDENNVSAIPLNLQANPDFDTPTFLSRNDFFEHFASILENQDGFEGKSYSTNNWYRTKKDVTKGLVVIQHEAPLLKLMALMENKELSIPDAMRFVESEYTRFKAKFLKTIVDMSREQDIELIPHDTLAVTALKRVCAGKTSAFAFSDTNVAGGDYFIPLTPALMGVTPLYRPEFVYDDTFGGEAIMFIRGHDGSMTASFGDMRDFALMALELRIYLNATPHDARMPMGDLVSGQHREALYSHAELTQIMLPMFERWARANGVSYENANFDEGNALTWNYSSCTDRYGAATVGHWRGIYQHYFDTDRPHLAPWEMLGFAERPDWWESHYGPAPYSRGNTILWDDIAVGVIREGARAGIDDRYARPDLMQVLPVDMNGEMLDPVAATIIPVAPPVQFAKSGWQFGDGSDIETIWRYSSAYAFNLAHAKFLMRPAYFVERFWDVLNEAIVHNQTVQTPEMRRIHHSEIVVHGEVVGSQTKRTLGVQNWITDHLRYAGKKSDRLGTIIRGLHTRLGHKVAGFTTPDRMTISAESFGLVPDEDITISIYRSPSMSEFFYSGILIENTPTGWRLVGYNPDYPFFDVIYGEETSRKTKITSGAPDTERAINPWCSSVYYKRDMLVEHNNQVFRCVSAHTSAARFEASFWTDSAAYGRQLSTTVVKHARDIGVVQRVEYGTEFRTKQEVADVLFGYERFLTKSGFVFDALDDTGASWVGAVRNFLRWSEVEWSDGAFTTLSPAARSLKFVAPTGIVVEMQNAVINRTGHYFSPDNFSVDRAEDETIITAHSDDIFGARLSKTEVEHCLIFSNDTIFGDVIFNPLFNIRQYRLKLSARVAGDWVGRYEAPGFVLQGDQIVPNFNKLGEDIRDMFDIELADNTVLRDHARHVIGFETRPYLDKLLLSETQQFEMYQGMIQQKGAKGALSSILRSSQIEQSRDLAFLEEWAFRIGTFGANHPNTKMELTLTQNDIRNEKQVVHLNTTGKDDWLNLPANRWVSIPANFAPLNVVRTSESMPEAGYVRAGETNYVYSTVNTFAGAVETGLPCVEGETLWTTHSDAWAVSRLNYPTSDLTAIKVLRIVDEAEGVLEGVEGFRIVFDKPHNLAVDDTFFLCGGTYDFYRGEHYVVRSSSDWVEVDTLFQYSLNFAVEGQEIGAEPPVALILRTLRSSTIAARDAMPAYPDGTLSFVDNAGDGKWKVYKKIAATWVEQRRQPHMIENKKIASAVIYETLSNLTATSLQVEPAVAERLVVVDPLAGLVPGIVDRELDYKLEYDPADYSSWGSEELGVLWWNLDTVRFYNYYTDAVEDFEVDSSRYLNEIGYRSEKWAKVTETSTVDIYEWTRSTVLPDDAEFGYTDYTEYNTALNRNVTVYYYWSKNPITVPRNSYRRISAKSCSEIIQNPARAGLIWYAAISTSAILTSGFQSLLDDNGRVLQLSFKATDYEGDEHAEWVLLRQGDKTSMPPLDLWNKLLDSLRGRNIDLKSLPSLKLHPTQRSGLLRRQSMFGDIPLADARQSFIRMLNYVLLRSNISTVGLLEEKLSLGDNPPEYLFWTEHTGDLALLPPRTEYDAVVLSHDDLPDALTRAYRVLVDNRSSDTPSWSVWRRGDDGAPPSIIKGYDRVVADRAGLNAVFIDMKFGDRTLVLNDENADGMWTIWEKRGDGSWDVEPFDEFLYDGFVDAKLGLVNSQKYRTRDFWSYVDWYDASVDQDFPPHVSYATPDQRNLSEGLNPTNDYTLVTDDKGYWSWTRFVNGEWITVARENGTIQLDEAFFTSKKVYAIKDDELFLDLSKIVGRDGTLELSPLIEALRTHVLTLEQINELWFSAIHFIHTKIDRVDWALKTSFLSVLGFNERLWASPVAVEENMPLLLQYIEEVKPYRATVRDILRTAAPDLEIAETIATDFDKPVYFDPTLEIYRRLATSTDADVLSQNQYRHFTANEDKRRHTKIGMLFDRIWPEANATAGAADRIMAYYQPGSNMRAKSLTDLLNLDFKGSVYDGSTLGETEFDIVLRGSNSAGSQIDLNVEGGFKLRDPHATGDKPEELISIGMHDGLVIRAHDRWGNGAPQHTVRHYDVSRRKTNTVTLDTGALVDSLAVFVDGVRIHTFVLDRLGNSVAVPITPGTSRAVALHGFGNAAVSAIREQRYYKGGAASYELADAFTGLVEASVNGALIDQAEVSVDLDTVTLPTTTASDTIMLTGYTVAEPLPIRQAIQTLTGNGPWQLTNLPALRPYHGSMIVEKNGLRLTPPKTYYATNESSYYVKNDQASDIKVRDTRTGVSETVVDVFALTTQEFVDEIELRAANLNARYVLWNSRVVFLDEDAAARDYVIEVFAGHDFEISDAGELTLLTSVLSTDDLQVTSFTNDEKMDIRTHVFDGNVDGIYTLRTTRNGSAWLTIDGRRMIENIDFFITERDYGSWDIDPFGTFNYDSFRFIQLAIRFPGEMANKDVVITTFEGQENNSATTWQLSTTTPDEMRMLPADDEGKSMYVVRKAWEIVSLDPIRRAAKLVAPLAREAMEMVVEINPSAVPPAMIPSQPLLVPDDKTPGVVWIDGERVEYFGYARTGNTITLSQLRRGTRGTAKAEHAAGALAMSGHELERLPPTPHGPLKDDCCC